MLYMHVMYVCLQCMYVRSVCNECNIGCVCKYVCYVGMCICMCGMYGMLYACDVCTDTVKVTCAMSVICVCDVLCVCMLCMSV